MKRSGPFITLLFLLVSISAMSQIDPLTAEKIKHMFGADTLARPHWINYFYCFDSPYFDQDTDTRPVQPPLSIDGGTLYAVKQVRKGRPGEEDFLMFGFLFFRGTQRGNCFSVAGIGRVQPVFNVMHDHFLKVPFESRNMTHAYGSVRTGGEGAIYFIMVGNQLTDLRRLKSDQLRIERNYIFARYGYKFNSDDLKVYYSMMGWYKPRFANVDKLLTEDDKALIGYIQALEKK